MTLKDILKISPLSSLDTDILMSFLLNKSREFLLAHTETEIKKTTYKKFLVLAKKRLAGWSMAVIVGQKDFYGRKFVVDKNVLVPRPETELLVEEILTELKSQAIKHNPAIIDVGTGSGAIIITLALETSQEQTSIPISFKGIDISAAALKIAAKNSLNHQLSKKIVFLKGNLLQPLFNKKHFPSLINDDLLIAANLPYLTPRQIADSPSIQKEPRLALVAGRDGLKYYRELFKQINTIHKNKESRQNRLIKIFCEIDPSQAKEISFLARKIFKSCRLKIKNDLANKKRLVVISLT
jgi:release factor glutamine methyltransferase